MIYNLLFWLNVKYAAGKLEDFVRAEKRLRFSIFFCGCKQSKSLHIFTLQKYGNKFE